MTQLRERATFILFGLLVVFVLSMTVGGLVGGADIVDIITGKNPDAIGVVNGVEISAKFYDQTYRQQLEQYRQQTNGEVSQTQENFLRNQVWESLVRDILVQKVIEEQGIKVTDKEIIYRLFNDPPEILKSNPAFQNEQKQFDMALYKAAINDPGTAGQWRPIEDYLRQSLPFERFSERLRATVRVTKGEIKADYLKRLQEIKVKYVFFAPKDFAGDNIEISDEMIQNYYNANKDDYQQKEQRAIEYITFSTKPTSKDSAEIVELAKKTLGRVKAGEDFAGLAEIYSEDPGSRDKGGDLGYFSQGTMVKEFDEAAFGAKVGEIVGPVKSNFGLHIIKIEDKRKKDGQDEVKASHILFKFSASKRTNDEARENADYLSEQSDNRGFAEIVTELGDSVKTTGQFVKGSGFIPGIGLNQQASNFIFTRKLGDVSSAFKIADGLLVLRIAEIKEESIKPLNDVKALIKSKLLNEKRMELTGQKANEIYATIENGLSLEDAVQKDSLTVETSNSFTKAGTVAKVGRDAAFIGTAAGLTEPGQISKPFEGRRGYYIVELVEKSAFDEKVFKAQRQQIKTNLVRAKQNSVFSMWYAKVKEEADIEDFRDRFDY